MAESTRAPYREPELPASERALRELRALSEADRGANAAREAQQERRAAYLRRALWAATVAQALWVPVGLVLRWQIKSAVGGWFGLSSLACVVGTLMTFTFTRGLKVKPTPGDSMGGLPPGGSSGMHR